jgi:hypothetical protein
MAIFSPTIEKIQQFKVPPTEGEWYLLRFLQSTLDDNYEVYFNPYLNGDRPDVVIMRKGGGVMIIEVKDWDLDLYQLDEKKHWHLKHPQNDGERYAYLKSPIDQVQKYKENLYNLHVETLLEQSILNSKLWGVVACAVYFHNASHSKIQDFLVNPYKDQHGYQYFIKKFDLIGRDDLNSISFNKILSSHYMGSERGSYYFSDSLYQQIHWLLQPPLHLLNQGETILRYDGRNKSHTSMMYSKKQDELIFDEKQRKSWRVKGVVGSGKTTLLAAKAVQSYKELIERGIDRPKILILTFNITLRNFIGDKISNLGGDRRAFTILHYHNFIKAQLNNLGIEVKFEQGDTVETISARKYDNYELFRNRADETEHFDVIFIDEIQDYKRVWMDIIKDYFLYKDGEYPQGGYYLLGDVKQNIYSRRTDGKDVATNVLGVNTLDTCFRSDMKIKDLAIGFQQTYFQGKYEIDSTLTAEEDKGLFAGQNIKQGYINYMYLSGDDPIQSVFNIIEGNIENKVSNEAINDITVLGTEISFLQLFETFYRYKTGRRTSTMFETYEIMFLRAMQIDNLAPGLTKELIKLMGRDRDRNSDQAMKNIANLLAGYELYIQFPSTFEVRLNSLCTQYKCNMHDFMVLTQRYGSELDRLKDFVFLKANSDSVPASPESREKLKKAYEQIREGKKYNFHMNSGNIKISTVHSFKGWESDTIFLLLQPKHDGSTSFDELLYTGITRTRSNLVVLNLGNKEYDEKMKQLIETYK